MPLLFVLLLLVFVALAVIIWATFNFLGLFITLIIAGLVGWLADAIVPGRLPYGWLGAIVAGLAGAWLGTMIVGQVGPDVAGIPILPALLGAVIIAFVVNWIAKAAAGRTSM